MVTVDGCAHRRVCRCVCVSDVRKTVKKNTHTHTRAPGAIETGAANITRTHVYDTRPLRASTHIDFQHLARQARRARILADKHLLKLPLRFVHYCACARSAVMRFRHYTHTARLNVVYDPIKWLSTDVAGECVGKHCLLSVEGSRVPTTRAAHFGTFVGARVAAVLVVLNRTQRSRSPSLRSVGRSVAHDTDGWLPGLDVLVVVVVGVRGTTNTDAHAAPNLINANIDAARRRGRAAVCVCVCLVCVCSAWV